MHISGITNAYFTESDIGAKIIAPSLFNAYITAVDTPATLGYNYSEQQDMKMRQYMDGVKD